MDKLSTAIEQAAAFARVLSARLGTDWDNQSKHDSQYYWVYNIPADQTAAIREEAIKACPGVWPANIDMNDYEDVSLETGWTLEIEIDGLSEFYRED